MRRLVLFARPPVLGGVKSRLAHEIGPEEALAVYRALVERTIAAAREVEAARALWLSAKAPAEAAAEVEGWRHALGGGIHLQPEGDLGARMASALRFGETPCVIIGTDAPGQTRARIEGAFDLLAENDVVLGATEDGGYDLLAAQGKALSGSFLTAGISWSSPTTRNDSRARAQEADLRVAELSMMYDVDTAAELARARREGLL